MVIVKFQHRYDPALYLVLAAFNREHALLDLKGRFLAFDPETIEDLPAYPFQKMEDYAIAKRWIEQKSKGHETGKVPFISGFTSCCLGYIKRRESSPTPR